MQTHILSLHTPSDPEVGSNFFSESKHVAYQIKSTLSFHTASASRVVSKGQNFFLSWK